MEKSKRSQVDFSQHDLKIIKNEDVLIYDLSKDNSQIHRVVFINSMGVLSVTGDFGNWIFCREFHASKEGKVSGGYWDEKLEISSVQKHKKFDGDQTLKAIQEYEDNYLEDASDEEKEWLEELKNNAYNEFDYTIQAYRHNPSNVDYESVPIGYVRHTWLNIVYDAFDEICSRM